MADNKLEDFSKDRIALIKVLVAASKSVDREYVWFYELEEQLKKSGLALGDYYDAGGEDNKMRRIRLQTNKGLGELQLNLMKARGISAADAVKETNKINIKPIKEVPDIGDVDDIMGDLL